MPAPNNLGVSLSGGGYRASAFHLGTLRALHTMNIINKIDVLSTISGGSITGAAYCLHKGDYEAFETEMVKKISTKNIVKYVLTSFSFLQLILFTLLFLGPAFYFLFTPYAWLFPILLVIWAVLLMKFQFSIFPVSKEIEKAYDKYYYQLNTLQKLCKRPTLAIGSSNLQTGRPFTFSHRKMGDSAYSAKFKQENFPISRAVMASSCVPFAFTPVSIAKEFYEDEEYYKKIDPKLIDGGVYDNQGIQKLTQEGSSYECNIVITSDAGGGLSFKNKYGNTLVLLIRTVDLFMNRIKTAQMADNIYQNVEGANRQIAYFSLGWDLDACIPGFVNNLIRGKVTKIVIDAHNFEPAWLANPGNYVPQIKQHLKNNVGYAAIAARDLSPDQLKAARSTGTNLTPLTEERIRLLAQHAENLTELQVKLYCPHI